MLAVNLFIIPPTLTELRLLGAAAYLLAFLILRKRMGASQRR